MIGSNGTIKWNRCMIERTYHTRNESVNWRSISIVVNGDFSKNEPNEKQLASLRYVIALLDQIYHFKFIIGHASASPTSCPGGYLLEAIQDLLRPLPEGVIPFDVSNYYTPVPGQNAYVNKNGFDAEFAVNCHGNCLRPADGKTKLEFVEPLTTAACPKNYPFGTIIAIDGYKEKITCVDRGGAIEGNRIDVWSGIGDEGFRRAKLAPSGIFFGRVLYTP